MVFQQPLHVLAAWPAADLAVLRAYLARRPPAAERVEAMLARFMAVWVGSKQAEGSTRPKPDEFLTFREPWPEPTESPFAKQRREALRVFRNLSARLRP